MPEWGQINQTTDRLPKVRAIGFRACQGILLESALIELVTLTSRWS